MSSDFYSNSEDFLLALADEIEALDEDSVFDVDFADGILDILVHDSGQEYVINRHNANQKIWYSSPISGADYFAFDEASQSWLNDKGVELKGKLMGEINKFLKK